jgi:hypothetical protein
MIVSLSQQFNLKSKQIVGDKGFQKKFKIKCISMKWEKIMSKVGSIVLSV